MARTKIKNGDIVQVPLPNDLGFAYAKYIDLLEINPNNKYPSLIRVYNVRELDSNFLIDNLANKELILSPLLIAGIAPTISKGIWKILGNVSVTEEEKVIPHYKTSKLPPRIKEDDWYYVIDADISKKIKSSYDNVKHLENIGATGSALVGTKIAMALIKDEGKKIEDYFELKEFFEKSYYEDISEIAAYYKQPEKNRGKALI